MVIVWRGTGWSVEKYKVECEDSVERYKVECGDSVDGTRWSVRIVWRV